MTTIEKKRKFLRADGWQLWPLMRTDQRQHLPPPPLEKPYPEDATLICLVDAKDFTVGSAPLAGLIRSRQSKRKYLPDPLTLEEMSFLLWATQGVTHVSADRVNTRRSVPSAGARHPLETYLFIQRVTGVEPGLYRYLPLEHKLLFLRADPDLPDQVNAACAEFAGSAAVVFFWTVIPYRTEWRYGALSARMIPMDAGHVCQNLYLACGAIGAGACAVAAFNQEKMDNLLGVDGMDEFTLYTAPVGKI